jgi:hypothetical protein
MTKTARMLLLIHIIISVAVVFAADSASQWKITSVKVCKSTSGSVVAGVDVLGNFPVYSFFIPRPVWTVNGSEVEAQPVYDRGRLTSFHLVNAARFLKSGAKNVVKFSLYDQNGAKVFVFDADKLPAGDCHELF